ncbi:hypothetical protein LBMAG56_54500 [Verrucomicrobiota bacterium]|nr:hypothetical protein LBMAG56_54500 [Verrucomicrobiota bacterium]
MSPPFCQRRKPKEGETIPFGAGHLPCDRAQGSVRPTLEFESLGPDFYDDPVPPKLSLEKRAWRGQSRVLLARHPSALAGFPFKREVLAEQHPWCPDPQIGVIGDLHRAAACAFRQPALRNGLDPPRNSPE